MMKESLVAGSLDMVIIDMQMPVMDGLETVTRFREHEAKQKYEVYMSIATTATATTSECTADAESISPLLSTVDTEGLSGRSTGNGNGISTFSLDDLVGENSQEFDSPSKISVRSASSTSSASSWEEPSDRRIMALDVETSVTKSPPLGTSMREHSDAAYTNHYMHTHSNGRVMSENLHCGMISSPKRPKALLGCMAAHEGPGAAYSTEDDSDNASTSNKVNGGHLSPRQHERSCTEDLFIVGMSANNDFETQEMALKAGMDAFIVKPFSFNDLEVVLKARMFH
jgi:CheY-like chemotaxis protein